MHIVELVAKVIGGLVALAIAVVVATWKVRRDEESRKELNRKPWRPRHIMSNVSIDDTEGDEGSTSEPRTLAPQRDEDSET